MEPTNAAPGSPEKIEVLRQRWANRLPLWHPQDAKIDQPEKPWEAPLPNREVIQAAEIARRNKRPHLGDICLHCYQGRLLAYKTRKTTRYLKCCHCGKNESEKITI